MDMIQMMGKLTIKQVVTDGYKAKAGSQVQVEIEKINDDIKTFDESMNKAITKLTLQGDPNVDMYRRQFMGEKEKLVTYRDQLKNEPAGDYGPAGRRNRGNRGRQLPAGNPRRRTIHCKCKL